ncbi:MAG: hypothetical protein L6R38_006166 [Xanthoria sp. 2 TBL-2021]|nr:MAG: hypothetical protein L6R38_006166 [Xanthoria sp. 2 TBL-2021]
MGAFFAGQSERGDASSTSELFKIYVQYKQDTRAIVSWLLSHHRAEGPTTSPGRLSVRDLIAIADQICGTAVAMPEAIAFQFRQAITARTHLSRVFRKVSKGSGESAKTFASTVPNHRRLASTPVGRKTIPARAGLA